MQERGLSSRDVGRILSVHPCTVRKWLMGMHRMPAPYLGVLKRYRGSKQHRT